MNARLKYGLYALYVLAALLASLYIRFPSETLGRYAVRRAEQLAPGMEVSVVGVAPALPAAVRVQHVEARYRSRPVLRLAQVRLAPAWGELLKLDPAWRLLAAVGGGRVRATFRRPENGPAEGFAVEADLDRIQLGELPGLQALAGRRISGLCSGNVSRVPTGAAAETSLRLRFSDTAVPLRQPIFQQNRVFLQNVEIDAALVGDRLQIRDCRFGGSEFDGRISGRVTVRQPLSDSAIDLEGVIEPSTVWMAELKTLLPAQILAKGGAEGTFGFRLSGSVANPRYSFR